MKNVLLLDDDKSLCFLMMELFEDVRDVEVKTVNSFDQFIDLETQIHSFDVIFLDVNLGQDDKSGLDAFKWLQDRNFQEKIVFFTGHAQAYPEVKSAVSLPNVFVLEKPASILQIEKMILD